MPDSIVKVPATSANLGPGYDCLGIALQLYNTVRLQKSKAAPALKNAMVQEAAEAFFQATKLKPFPFEWSIEGEVPQSRGLGSSVTVRLGILHGLNDQCGSPLSRERLFEICAELEGHPDNAAPAAFGGFTISAPGLPLQRYRVESRLEIALLIPDLEVLTAKARKVLPAKVSFQDAVFNCAQAAAIAGAFASRQYEMLEGAFDDRLHQSARAAFVPFLEEVIAAGRRAGALGGWLSGSGSTVACATLGSPEKVAAAMLGASGLQHARAVTARADNSGVRVSRGR